MVEKLTPKVRETFYRLRDQVKTMPVGMPLPAFTELKDRLNVGQLTIQRAYDILEDQGYISRKVGKGVYVADRTQTGEFAIAILPELLSSSASPYYSLACNALIEATGKRRPDLAVKMHFGTLSSDNDFIIPPDLLSPETSAKLRGIFSFHPLFEAGERLVNQGVPVITLGSEELCPAEHRVSFDREKCAEQYMSAMLAAGCRSVGILGSVVFDGGNEHQVGKSLTEAAQAFGLRIKPEWLPVTKCHSAMTDKVGYEQFMQLWNQDEKPDGLIVLDDVICKGVLLGCLQLGVDLPRDVQLISRANRLVDLPYYKSVTRLEFDALEQAQHAVNIAIDLLRGSDQVPLKTVVPGRLVPGDTTLRLQQSRG